MKIKLEIQYDGTHYAGWQRQKNGISIQEKIEEGLQKLFGERVVLHGASRTDSGVHAKLQVAHFRASKILKNIDYALALNTQLPHDIRILSSQEVSEDFHAMRSTKSKIYEYFIYNKPVKSALYYRHSLWVPQKLDVLAMDEASQYLVGVHDFKSFQASNSCFKTTVREIFGIKWKEKEEFLVFSIQGSGFLKYMVRIIVGTLLEVGKGNVTPLEFKEILNSKDRSQAGRTARPQGLFLKEVLY
ncbi:MAG: tRNA pseudouridine(38-40) synthase TruA [Deltaproteobacteria bacterium]|nr:tRNA pseudouridine(38-40) synthase TruA [Deltaproteobacteria bacterium]